MESKNNHGGYRTQAKSEELPLKQNCTSESQYPAFLELLRLQSQEAASGSEKKAAKSMLAARLAGIFEELPADALLLARHELDSNLSFRRDGSAVDLRTLVFEVVPAEDRSRILKRIQTIARGNAYIPPAHRGMVVLSDVDDTLLPGSDQLQIAGSDRSWALDGRLYPGVAHLHRELRGKGMEDYSVVLTARPPLLCSSLPEKLGRIVGRQKPRLSILPGEGGRKIAKNLMSRLNGDYNEIAKLKISRLLEYAALFPECVGRFVFLGDDGQGDVKATCEMLGLKDPDLGIHLLAFAGIKAVCRKDGFIVSAAERNDLISNLRANYPPVPTPALPAVNQNGQQQRPRFFYFTDYEDLVEQLAVAGWISAAQCGEIQHAAERDREAIRLCVARGDHDLFQIQYGLQAITPQLQELDEMEIAEVEAAASALPGIAAAHVLLSLPKDDSTLNVVEMVVMRVEMPENRIVEQPFLAIRTGDRKKSWEGQGAISVPLHILKEEGSRVVIKVFSSKPLIRQTSMKARSFLGRCYAALEPTKEGVMPAASPVCGDREHVSVVLLGADRATIQEVGQVVISCRWHYVEESAKQDTEIDDFSQRDLLGTSFGPESGLSGGWGMY